MLGCRIVQRIFIKKGGKKQLFLAVQLRRPKGGKPYVHLQLPLGLALQSGVIIAVMDGKNKKPKLSYKTSLKTCVPRGCIATMPLEKKLLAAMKASNVHAHHIQKQQAKDHQHYRISQGLEQGL